MKRIYNLLLIFALVLVGGMIGANNVFANTDEEYYINLEYSEDELDIIKFSWSSYLEDTKTYRLYGIETEDYLEAKENNTEPEFTLYRSVHSNEDITINNLKKKTSYTFYLEAESTNGNIVKSNEIEVYLGDFRLKSYYGAERIELDWDEVSDAESYNIYISEDDGASYDYYDNTESTSYSVRNLKGEKAYSFIIYALDEDDEEIARSNYTYSWSFAKLKLSVQINGTDAKLSWNKHDQADSYQVICAEDDEGYFSENYKDAETTNTSYTLKGLKPNTDYLCEVRAYRENPYHEEFTSSDIIKKRTGYQTLSSTSVTPIKNKTYNGKSQKPGFTIKDGTTTLKLNKDYKITGYKNNINVGTAKITIQGIGGYTGTKTLTFKITKAKNPIKVTAKNKKVKYKKLKKKKQVITSLNATEAQGKVTYAKVSGNKRFKINKTTGKITVKKKTKKGTYYLKFKVTAAGNKNYKAKAKTVTMKVVIK